MRPMHCVLVVAGAVALAPIAAATDWYVDASYASCSTSTGSPTQPFCRISKAILAASSGDTIHIAPGTYVHPLDVDRSLTFIGTQGAATTIVSGQKLGRAVAVRSGVTADFSGLSIVDGWERDCGGMLIESGATVTLQDCAFKRNAAQHYRDALGGAITATQASIVVERCTFLSNFSVIDGGAIWNSGGTLSVLDCDFRSNSSGTAGGALWNVRLPGSSTVDVERTTFTDNFTDGFGGAIGGEDYSVVDCVFSGNSVRFSKNGYGGAIAGTLFTLLRCEFDGNKANWGGAVFATDFTAEACHFDANSTWGKGAAGDFGGAIRSDLGATLVDCVFESNVVNGGSVERGGALYLIGTAANPATASRCRIAGNHCIDGPNGGIPTGGGVYAVDDVSFIDCEIVGNEARGSLTNVAGDGGGIAISATNGVVSLVGCTVAGNLCTNTTGSFISGGGGGGIDVIAGSCDLDDCIVAGNFAQDANQAQDVAGPVNSIGWNDFGDTQFTNITGPGTGDLLDVDPLFADASNGDFSLSSLSPCIDSGDPTRAPTGRDVANFPRFLDGDLDRVQVVDRGAHEFCNVALAISGSLTPGGSATLATSGSAGLPVLVFAGVATAELAVHPFGALFVDLSQPFVLFPFGTIPNSQVFTLGASLPVPLTVELQAVALAGNAGNLGNLLEVVIR